MAESERRGDALTEVPVVPEAPPPAPATAPKEEDADAAASSLNRANSFAPTESTECTPTETVKVSETLLDALAFKFPEAEREDLQRFLTARKGDAEKAAEMFAKHLQWRAGNLPIQLTEEVKAVLRGGLIFSQGVSKAATPCIFIIGAFYDTSRGLTVDHHVQATLYALERVLSGPPPTSRVSVFIDLRAHKGARNAAPDLFFIKNLASILQDNYPERLHQLVIYPFPWIAKAIWHAAKVFIDTRTREKIELVTGDASEGKPVPEEVFQFIDKKAWPKEYEGEREESIQYLV
uniref:CRAL-TRIO domain-containing protein n=1 Tax=Chromera velia CCMP2878 TaxID=1169474 RepID=A0A0G4GDC6_9ALVE|eukprot:Cvel_629.t1-p1 / transcript=Cvel_629.t1 / gene=Cvel_629 / organism=Chromera_velia_CCMP2878 / gene_product=CRAL-TRIO domain-containing protein C23B6.04c, putative / transcript_product=CRAL-TRIO domain-containing protein C23B6.04c, putative / location=Cvel_scaffold19:114403-117664(+) / protein_length=291 / sequence_SO=supercontig / SO=protein_coding / is_pseudo=false